MSTENDEDDFDLPGKKKKPIKVTDLPWYETLRKVLEPYKPVANSKDADVFFTSSEIISSIEQHHGVPQGIVGANIKEFVFADDFVRAMRYCGFTEVNAGGVGLQWIMKKK